MKQNPSQLKYRKNHKIGYSIFSSKDQKSFFPNFGNFGIQCLRSCKLEGPELEACRKSIRRSVKGIRCSLIQKAFKGFSVTKKGMGSRMGSGKGSHNKWICPIKAGFIVYELRGAPEILAVKALKSGLTKLRVKARVVKLIY